MKWNSIWTKLGTNSLIEFNSIQILKFNSNTLNDIQHPMNSMKSTQINFN